MASENSFKEKVIKMFDMKVDDDYEADEEYEEEEYEEEVEEEAPVRRPAGRGVAGTMTAVGGPEVLVLDPEFFEDAPMIVNKIKDNKTVVVNLKNTEYEDGRKIFDFLNGAVFALEGSINKIADNVFILAPSEVSVSTEIEKNADEYITPILDWDAE